MILRINSPDMDRAFDLGSMPMIHFGSLESLMSNIKFSPGGFPIQYGGKEFDYFLLPIGLMCVKDKEIPTQTESKTEIKRELARFIIDNWFNEKAEKTIDAKNEEINIIQMSPSSQPIA
ncbi:MAG: hypothetical protein M0P71_07570 [Melioribacteraceae bacterium]|jgi:hypothetical protein|nr:hypothetical protein [Melioribacteraceae bacterium]MDD3982781.1 hypothetical protein [Candidatus Omnitrophota bacterium]